MSADALLEFQNVSMAFGGNSRNRDGVVALGRLESGHPLR